METQYTTQKHLATLESLLVSEFRTCQALQKLVKSERSALSKGDVSTLNDLVEEKEVILDKLGQIEDERRMVVQELAQQYHLNSSVATVFELLPHFDTATAGRMGRLCDGISTIVGQVREFNTGNQALATSALERVDSVQAYLLSLIQVPANYHPPGAHPAPEQTIVWDIDQKA